MLVPHRTLICYCVLGLPIQTPTDSLFLYFEKGIGFSSTLRCWELSAIPALLEHYYKELLDCSEWKAAHED